MTVRASGRGSNAPARGATWVCPACNQKVTVFVNLSQDPECGNHFKRKKMVQV